MQKFAIIGFLAVVGLTGCDMMDSRSAGTSATSAAGTSGTSAPSSGDLWRRCMVQGEMASCQEIWKTL
ncbi:MAG: hypothetical protein JWL84_4577 [Rhodospirillales bacterium]|jgi:hypothetical protein|nr:hypothetical protein [Rhodospirillales bacterium]